MELSSDPSSEKFELCPVRSTLAHLFELGHEGSPEHLRVFRALDLDILYADGVQNSLVEETTDSRARLEMCSVTGPCPRAINGDRVPRLAESQIAEFVSSGGRFARPMKKPACATSSIAHR
jgi:hypothetical protein